MRLHTGLFGHREVDVDSGRKIPCRTGESNLRQQRAGPMLYQLSYIPTPLLTSSSFQKSPIPGMYTCYVSTSLPDLIVNRILHK